MNRLKHRLGFCVIGLIVSSAHGATATFERLGDLPGGDFRSVADAVSHDGSTVVGTSSSASGTEEAFRWTRATGIEGLGDLSGGAFRSAANGVSSDGSVVVGLATSASGTEAFRWTAGGAGMQGLGDLPGSSFFSNAIDVSGDGSIVVGFGRGAAGFEAVRWVNGGAPNRWATCPAAPIAATPTASAATG